MKSKLLSSVEAVIPTDFYYVREVIPPKAGWLPMFGFTAFIFASAVISFGLLYHSESHKTSTETITTAVDYNGANGYTCQMISKVSASYLSPDGQEPSIAFSLVNVIETATECESNLQTALPCEVPLNYFPGATTDLYPQGLQLGALAMYGNDIAFFWPSLTRYNYSSGQFFDGFEHLDPADYTATLAVDRNGLPIYLLGNDQYRYYTYVYRSYPNGVYECVSLFAEYYSYMAILNDNLYNIYLVQNNTFQSLDVYDNTSLAYGVELFTNTAGDITFSAVYHDGVSPTVYYCTTNDTTTVFTYKDGVYSSLGPLTQGQHCAGLTITEFGYLFILVRCPFAVVFTAGYWLVNQYYGTMGFISAISQPPTGFAVDPEGTRIMLTLPGEFNGPKIAVMYIGTYGTPYSEVKKQTQFAAGWYTCGDKTLLSTEYNSAAPAEYSQACNQNGIVSKLIYNNVYYFTESEASAYAVRYATDQCTAPFSAIVSTVSNLPPYSCTRTVKQDFFTSIGTSFANTSLLVQILIFVFAMLLPTVAAKFPAKENVCLSRADIKRLKKILKQDELNSRSVIELKSSCLDTSVSGFHSEVGEA